MTPIKRHVTYIFNSGLLMLRVTWPVGTATLSTGLHIDRDKWNGSRCRAGSVHGRGRTPAETANRVIAALERDIDDAFSHFEAAGLAPTPAQLRERVRRRETPQTIEQAYTQFMRDGERTRQWSANTLKSVRNLLRLVTAFRPGITLADVTPGLMEEFAAWQQTHRLSGNTFRTGQRGYANNVIRKNCTVFRWFVRWAGRRGLVRPEAADGLTPHVKAIPRPVIYLTWEELARLEAHPYEEGSEMDRARDFFVFCCFSSLRYSDAAALRKTSVGPDSLTVTTVKTADTITVDLNDHTRRILAKYAGEDSPLALPRVTNSRLNRLVKQMGKDTGMTAPVTVSQYYGAERVDRTLPKWELLSSHAGRRTFIVNALSLGIAPSIVMKWTGHSDYSAMRPYIDIADGVRRSAMALFNR